VLIANGFKAFIWHVENANWREAPPLPFSNLENVTPYQLNDGIMSLGGNAAGFSMGVLTKFDEDALRWINKEYRLEMPKEAMAVVGIPDDFAICQ